MTRQSQASCFLTELRLSARHVFVARPLLPLAPANDNTLWPRGAA